MSILESVATIVLTVGAGAILNWLFRVSASKLQDDAERMNAAVLALMRHRTALETVLHAGSVDNRIKDALLFVSWGSQNRDVATVVVHWIEKGAPHDKEDDASLAFRAAIRHLGETDPAMLDNVQTTIVTALAWMILQWPETAARVRAFINIASEPRDQIVYSANIFRRASKEDDIFKPTAAGPLVAAHA